jgi:hemolysin activation/secretion protein
LNDQNSPGTPDMRINSSLVYDNLWQLEHSIGVQYSFSPEALKSGNQWNVYDQPQVANYGAYYRLPLGSLEPIEDIIATDPGSFGYDEATHKFRLPPPSGRAELNFYVSRSTIDTGVMTLTNGLIYSTNGNSLTRQQVQQDLTINQTIGSRLNFPLASSASFQSGLSGGFDYKTYDLTSGKTNLLNAAGSVTDSQSDPNHPQTNINNSQVISGTTTHRHIEYLPLALRYDASLRDRLGVTTFGLGLGGNSWFSGPSTNVQSITSSSRSSGYWVTVTPSLGRDLFIHTNWVLSLHADGQWASEPLISNEQFGLGGLAGVRGYHEGEVFGDTGWRFTAEQKTPCCVVGTAYRNHPLTVRGSVFMDYGEVYLLDPQSRQDRTPLWGVGFGGVASIGANWQTRFLFSWPLLSAGTTQAGQPRFDFGLTAQF